MTISELQNEYETYSKRAKKYLDNGDTKNAKLFQKYADQALMELKSAQALLLGGEKKNEQPETAGEQQQASTAASEGFDSVPKSVDIPINDSNSGNNADLEDELKFANTEAFQKFHDLKMKVHTELVNWVARKTPKTELEKRKKYAAVEYWCSLAIDQVMRTAKYEYQKMILEKEFSITFRDKTKDVYTLNVEQLAEKYNF